MKKIFSISMMALIFSTSLHSQTPSGNPQNMPFNYYRMAGFLQADSGILLPRRVANFTPKSTTIIFDTVSGSIKFFIAGAWKEIKPVSFTGDYNDLLNKPTVTFSQNVTVNGPSGTFVGVFGNGEQIPLEGKTLDQFAATIAIKAVPPNYSAPSASISSSPSGGSFEIGTNMGTITLSAFYTQNDGGAATGNTFAKYISIWNNLASNTDNLGALNVPTYYRVTTAYNQGACKNNNTGVLDCTGRINSGSVSSGNIALIPYPKIYTGFTQNTTVTSADVLAATTQSLASTRVGTVTWDVPSGADIYPFYAYPVGFGAIPSVTDFFTGASIDMSGFFSQQTIAAFTNAQGYTQQYYVYRLTNKQPASATIKINIQ